MLSLYLQDTTIFIFFNGITVRLFDESLYHDSVADWTNFAGSVKEAKCPIID